MATADEALGCNARGDTPESALAALRAALHTWTNPQKGHTPDSLVFKQALIIRRDLKMQRGKEIAQGAHAAMAAVLPNPPPKPRIF